DHRLDAVVGDHARVAQWYVGRILRQDPECHELLADWDPVLPAVELTGEKFRDYVDIVDGKKLSTLLEGLPAGQREYVGEQALAPFVCTRIRKRHRGNLHGPR